MRFPPPPPCTLISKSSTPSSPHGWHEISVKGVVILALTFFPFFFTLTLLVQMALAFALTCAPVFHPCVLPTSPLKQMWNWKCPGYSSFFQLHSSSSECFLWNLLLHYSLISSQRRKCVLTWIFPLLLEPPFYSGGMPSSSKWRFQCIPLSGNLLE